MALEAKGTYINKLGKDQKKNLDVLIQVLKEGGITNPIFIDKDGNVWGIHTGFNGPATGEAYMNFKNKIRYEIEIKLDLLR